MGARANGSAHGLSPTGSQLWHQDQPDVESVAEPGDRFGPTLAASDFNDDGFDDLAVDVPLEAVDDVSPAGAVNVIYGSAQALSATAVPDQIWHAGSPPSRSLRIVFGRTTVTTSSLRSGWPARTATTTQPTLVPCHLLGR